MILCIEFSNILVDAKRHPLDILNREMFYTKTANLGYKKTKHFCELPQWPMYIKGMTKDADDFRFHICENIDETINQINKLKPAYVMFSAMLATTEYITTIVNNIDTNLVKVIIGLCIGTKPMNLDNVYQYDSLEALAKMHNFSRTLMMSRLSMQSEYNPRIYTTSGCMNACKFCQKESNYTELPNYIINNYITLRDYDNLVYVGNKTFGQSPNELHNLESIKDTKFIIQSSVTTLSKNIHNFEAYHKAGIIIVEIGVESFSQSTLLRLGKHISFAALRMVVDALNNVGIKVIFNIMLGIKDDSKSDYDETLKGLNEYESDLLALNITNYTDYNSDILSDRDERIAVKSWNASAARERDLRKFSEDVYKFNFNLLNKL